MESLCVPVEKEILDGFCDIGRQEGLETDGDIFRYLMTLHKNASLTQGVGESNLDLKPLQSNLPSRKVVSTQDSSTQVSPLSQVCLRYQDNFSQVSPLSEDTPSQASLKQQDNVSQVPTMSQEKASKSFHPLRASLRQRSISQVPPASQDKFPQVPLPSQVSLPRENFSQVSPPTQDKFSQVYILSRDNFSQVSPAPQDKSSKVSSPSKVSVAIKQDNCSQISPSPKDDFSNLPSLVSQSQDSSSQILPPLPCNFSQTSQLSSDKSSQVSQSLQTSLQRQENFSQALPTSQDKSLQMFSESHTASGHTQFSSAQKSGPVHRKSQRKQIYPEKVERMWLRSQTLSATTASGCRRRRTQFETANARESRIRRRFLEEEDVRTKKKNPSFPLSHPAHSKPRQHDARPSTAARSGGKGTVTPLRTRGRRSSQQTLSPKGVSKLRQTRRKKDAKQNSPLQVDSSKSLRSLSKTYGKQTSQCARTILEQPGTEDRRGESADGKERFKCLHSADRGDKRQAKQMTEGICKRRGRPRKKDAEQTFPKQTSVLRQQAKGRKICIDEQDITDIQTKKRSTLRPKKTGSLPHAEKSERKK